MKIRRMVPARMGPKGWSAGVNRLAVPGRSPSLIGHSRARHWPAGCGADLGRERLDSFSAIQRTFS